MSSMTGDGEVVPSRPTVTSRGRAWSAYVLTLLLPGAGHLSVGQWRRGLAWAATYAVALVFLATRPLLVDRALVEPVVVTAVRIETVGFVDVAFPLAVVVLCLIDCYALAALGDTSA